MGGKIDAFVDCVSPYSYYAALHLLRNKEVLTSHGVDIEFHPFFLGGVNVGSGNKPPWTLPAKAKYMQFDGRRAQRYFGATKVRVPSFFPIVSLLPQRCIIYVKEHFPSKFESSMLELWIAMFEEQVDISKPDQLSKVLARHFSAEEIEEILKSAGTSEYKQKLNENTQRALNKGAFGAPWFWARNGKGEEESFFGSDRFHFMWDFLGLPWSDIAIQEKAKM